MVRKKVPTELQKAEVKLRTLMERRDRLNEEANLARQERNDLHDRKRELSAEARGLKDKRDAIVKEMRAHKGRRNQMQVKAKQLIEMRRKVRGKVQKDVGRDLATLRREIEKMELDQQTRPMKISEENELLDDLKGKVREIRELEKEKGARDAVLGEVRDIDGTIDELFKKADEEHANVVAKSQAANELHDKVTEVLKGMSVLIAESNKKHEEYIELRQKADEQHQLVLEMRQKVLTIRGAAREERREARNLMRQQKEHVRKELLDEKKLNEFADKAVESLMKKGKVEIRG